MTYPWSVDEVLQSIYWTEDIGCGPENWFKQPVIPLVAATYYRCVVVVLGGNPETCLPMTATVENQEPPTKVRAIAHVNGNHYVPVR